MDFSVRSTVRFALACAVIDIRDSFRRSYLGPVWRSFASITMIVLLGLFFGAIFKRSILDFDLYYLQLALGVLVWDFLSLSVNQSCSLFSSNLRSLRYTAQPFPAFYLRICLRNFFVFLLSIGIVLLIYSISFDRPLGFSVSIFPGLFLLTLSVFAISTIVGIACARFRDLPQFVSWLTHIWFFLTPIIWPSDVLGRYQYLNDWNPAFHYVNLIRIPFTGRDSSEFSLLFAVVATAVALGAAVVLLRRFGNKVAYWI